MFGPLWMKVSRMVGFAAVWNSSTNGTFALVSSCSIRWKWADSRSPIRTYTPTVSRTALSRNGTRQSLHHPHQDEQHRCPDPDLFPGGHQPDQESAHAHQGERDDQHALTAEPIPEVSEDDAADRPEQERHAEGGQRDDRADGLPEAGEEQPREHQRGGAAVEEVVVPLQGGAEKAGERCPQRWVRER